MHSSRYIEIQAPFLNSLFLEWFIKHVMSVVHDYHLLYGSAWGYSTIWCNAARTYAKEVLKWDDYKMSCGILAGAKPVLHLDSR